MVALASMGGTQGLVGWWMVKSGLGDDRRGDSKEIRVRPIRLAAHLSMAVATYGALLWTGWDVLSLPYQSTLKDQVSKMSSDAFRVARRLRPVSILLTASTAATIVSGALVAGNDAGRAFNTWPKMDDDWIPEELYELEPFSRNLTEHTATVQFHHRVLASCTAATAIALSAWGLLRAALVTPQVRNGLIAVGVAATGQFTLGIATLVHYVPLGLAAAHQVGSLVVFTSSLYLAHALRYARPALRSVTRSAAAAPRAIKSASPKIT